MSAIFLFAGLILAGLIVASSMQLRSFQLRMAAIGAAAVVLGIFFTLASFQHVDENSVGVVSKKIGFTALEPGKIIATNGEKGPQAEILPPGWNLGYWPFIYDIEKAQVEVIPPGSVGLLVASDGQPLPRDTTYAPEWPEGKERQMQNAEYFLTDGGGYKGPQTTVLKPGSYRINPVLFSIEQVPATSIEKATVGVVKSNVGDRPVTAEGDVDNVGQRRLVAQGERGIWRQPLLEGEYYLNSKAYQVTTISTQRRIVRYTAHEGQLSGGGEEREIKVRTSDGFTFPVDVRVDFEIEPRNAPLLVASVSDDQVGLQEVMNSAVRATFRNNAQAVKALDYVKQRKEQEDQSKDMLQEKLAGIGVTIINVQIGDVGDEKSLGNLLKTQMDREIAIQEQETFQEQQRAAEQKKQLTKTEQ
ncbi:MAG: hypothetical protein GXP24_13440, partial [Planctomycetes bacterium]|nr:hypothetical protein [Planctomycetota bacterium]